MFRRRLALPSRSFFLFGARGTGKSTWLRQMLPDARWYDLLHGDVYLRLLADPSQFRLEVEALAAGTWVVVDEVQRIPALLNEVQSLIARHPRRWRFALCGSSARKLRRLDVNLLAGRVVNRRFFPLVWAELPGHLGLDEVLRYGLLPQVRSEPADAIDILDAYASNYLREEIQQEALTRDLASFSRFLRVAALMNGQVVNVSGISRDAGVPRPTVQRYFDVLADTLVGHWLPAWQPRIKIREVAHPKFYLFDCGVVRAVSGRLRAPLHDTERGPALETWMFHELRAHLDHAGVGGELSYYRTPAGVEVDFIWSGPGTSVAIEVKAATTWRSADGASLKDLYRRKVAARVVGVYRGEHPLRDGPVYVWPVRDFLARLPSIIR
jgi:predicted AAA+ superfamily ATPase